MKNMSSKEFINFYFKIMTKEMKYGDDDKFESFFDRRFFLPIADKLIPIAKKFNFTPNFITLISTLSAIFSVFLFSLKKVNFAIFFYLLSYLADCMDGRMARKYNMGSEIGMCLDFTSDILSNSLLILYFAHDTFKSTQNSFPKLIIFLLISSLIYLLSLSFSFNEALACKNKNNHFNFYQEKVNSIKNNNALTKLYLNLYHKTWITFNSIYPSPNKSKLEKILINIKEFNSGNFIIFICFIMYLWNFLNI
jgi:phosphatidylglycerophosphate synthase